MLTALLPSSSAPISRSRACQQAVDDRGAAVAVLLEPQHARARRRRQRRLAAGEERTTSSRQTRTMQDGQPVLKVHRLGELLGQEGADLGGIDVGARRKPAPMPRARMKVSLPRLHLLVLGDQLHQRVGVRQRRRAPSRMWVGRPTAARWRDRRARPPPCGSSPSRAENSNASAMPIATASPCSSRSEKPAAASNACAERVAEIEQRALAGLALVARRRSRPWRGSSIAIACSRAGAAGEHVAPVRFEPGEERRRRRAARTSTTSA